jgi:hypothetical protein
MAACEACLLACLIPPARTIELVRLDPSRDGAERHHDPHWPPNRVRDPGGCRTRAEDQYVRIANQVVFLEEGVGGWGEKSDMTVVRLGPVSRHSGLGAAEPLARACGECEGGVSVRVRRGRSRAGCVVVRQFARRMRVSACRKVRFRKSDNRTSVEVVDLTTECEGLPSGCWDSPSHISPPLSVVASTK